MKIEAPSGDPLRRWSASGATIADGDDGALFNHLAASKRSVVVEPATAGRRRRCTTGCGRPTSSCGRGGRPSPRPPVVRRPSCSPPIPTSSIASITPFGLDGPWSDRPATEFTLQAWSGGDHRARPRRTRPRSDPRRRPDRRMADRACTPPPPRSPRCAAATDGAGRGEIIDVSMLEVMASCLTYYPVTFQQQLGYPMRRKRFVPTPGVAAASDGLVGLGCGTGQQWLDVCAMVGHPEWMEERSYFLDRTALAPTIDAWVAEHTVAEVTDLASAFRIPNAPIVDGANAADDRPLRRARRVRREPARRGAQPRPAVPAVVGRCCRRAARRRHSASTPPTSPIPSDAPPCLQRRGQAPTLHAAVRGPAGARHDGVLGRARSSATSSRCSVPR